MFDVSLRRIVFVASIALLISGSAAFAAPANPAGSAAAPEIRLADWTRILFTSVGEAVRMIPGLGSVGIPVPPPNGTTGEGYGLDPHGKP